MKITRIKTLFTLNAMLLIGCIVTLFGYNLDGQNEGYQEVNQFTVFMEDGGWCWFQDPRAIVHGDYLIMGSVKGNDSGGAYIGVYDLRKNQILGNILAHDQFDHDDHNAPVFYLRPDQKILAVYARHGTEKIHYTRLSDAVDYLKWGQEQLIDQSDALPPGDGVTYMNLMSLRAEGKLYNFYRGFDFNPSFITSSDEGETWSKGTHFIRNELPGRHRPYARYVGNGVDTIHVCFTDAHPRHYGNNLYYVAFRNGKFYKANGDYIKDLEKDGPLLPSEADLVYHGSNIIREGGHGASALGSAWNSSIVLDAFGNPHIGYSLYLNNDDHRFRVASWDGSKWIDREVAYAGKCLWDMESSYTGLITLDPVDPYLAVISTDVNPSTGMDSGGKHEIYRGRVGIDNDIGTIKWVPMTTNSTTRNIRPVILRNGNQRVICWNRGRFDGYLDYDLQTVGIIEKVAIPEPTAERILALASRVSKWQIATFENQGAFRALPRELKPWNNREKHHELDWTNGALYVGMNEWRKVSKDAMVERFLLERGVNNNWSLFHRPYHADDHTVGQLYLDFYREHRDEAMLAPTQKVFDHILENPRTGTLEWTAQPTDAHHRWGWCDSLFMAPPVWAKLAMVTGDIKYLEFMNQEYHATYDLLWDHDTHLFWRDSSYFERREANGQKLFWSRGNGWVFGGLALMIPNLPVDWNGRGFYISLFQKMAMTIKEHQRSDGTWSAGMLGNEQDYPNMESSGTAFFTYGLAWGIRNGYLDEVTYKPTIIRAWKALTQMVNAEGMLGFVQPIGAAPGDSYAEYSEVYGVGAFLAAASELYQLLNTQD